MAMSIGKIGGIGFDAVSNRYKGVLTRLAESPEDVERELDRCIQQAGPQGSRLTVRVFTSFRDKEKVKDIRRQWKDATLQCEAFIPHRKLGVAYFGANIANRRSSENTVAREQALLQSVMATPPKDRNVPDGFTVEILSRGDQKDIADLVAVYNSSYTKYIMEFTTDSVARMVYENTVAVARNGGGRIVAVSQGEVAEVPQVGVRLIELSDTATYPDYRSKGLTTLCKMKLIEELKAQENAIIFAESRAVSAPVNRQNFSVGMKVGGRLEKHCKIASAQAELPQEGDFGNMVVWYLPTT